LADRTIFGPSVIQEPKVLENAWAVARFGAPSLPEALPEDLAETRRGYQSALHSLQVFKFPVSMVSRKMVFDFGPGAETEAALTKLIDSDPLPADWRFEDEDAAEIRATAEGALDEIAALDPGLHRGLLVVVSGFIFARRPGLEGGSISALTGPIWLDPREGWTSETYVENMVHEYTHQCLFLDEMVNTIFAKFSIPEMSTPEALVTSTILKRKRPYDKAYHSAFVANVLAQLYIFRGREEKASEYLRSTRATTDELLDRPEFVTPNGLASLEALSEEVDAQLADLH
jgi:hypothetical protein